MQRTPSRSLVLLSAVTGLVALFAISTFRSEAAETIPVGDLRRHTHIHGLAVDRHDPSRLLIATHHGLFRAGPDGKAERISEVQDFMGFNAHPSDANMLYASGHPARGGNLGFIASADQGKTWRQVSPGVDGPVDFHQMTVSPADPQTIYGAYQGLQVSRDGGRQWMRVAAAPDKLIDLAASARDASTLYAATEDGLFVSTDGGRTWEPVLDGAPVSLVEVTPNGTLYAFVGGRGLLRTKQESLNFTRLGDDFGGFLLHLAVDPTNPDRLFVATSRGQVLTSNDQGRTWVPFGRSGS